MTISSPSGGGGPAPTLGTSSVITTTIGDDDDAISGIALTVSPTSVGEDDGKTEFTVTASLGGTTTRPSSTVVTLTLAGTAGSSDYTVNTALGSITIPANETSATGTLELTPTDDAVVEGDETIIISGTTTTQVGLNVTSATITLNDHNGTTTGDPDDKDSSELSIAGPSANVAEGSDATFTVTLSAAVSKEVTVAWTATGNTDDYSPDSGTVTFAAGSAAGATEDIDIAVTDDDLSEVAESFTVTLGTVGGNLSSQVTVKSSANSDTATIAASDPITINITGPSNVDEGDGTTAYTVSLSPSGVKPTADLTVSYATAHGTATTGDYTAKSETLTFTNAAAGSQTFTVQTTEDTFDESDETFTVTISSPSGGGGPTPTLGTSSVVTTTIDDDDDAISGIALTVSPTSVGEDDGKTEFTVTASFGGTTTRASNTVVTLTLGGTAGSSDYTVNTALGSITIPANETSATGTLELTPTDDAVVEDDETIIISGTTTVTGLNVTSATITLNDHNGTTTGDPNDKDSAELSISGPSASVSEGSDATFTVTLSAAVSKEATVAWTATGNTDDYSPDSGTVTFAAGSTAGATEDITITATDDMLSETAESFTVTLGTITSTLSSQLSLKSGASSATATIAESDPITISISGPSNVDEGDATSNYTVSLSPDGVTPTSDLTVSYATANGTATAGSDYTGKSGTLTFTNAAAGAQTFTVQTTGDDIDEGTGETFTVTISSPVGRRRACAEPGHFRLSNHDHYGRRRRTDRHHAQRGTQQPW